MLTRPVAKAYSGETFDVLVVGAGICGVMMALEAARRGLRPLLLDQDDFGGATSHNSLRIVHGGLRYLQSADLRRHLVSTRERRWIFRNFPDLVRPLPCLMPLYGEGLQKPLVLQAALAANDLLGLRRNRGVENAAILPPGRLVAAAEATGICPDIGAKGLKAAALWYDGFAPNLPRLLIEALHWACSKGAVALNHLVATGLETSGGRISGLRALDRRSGEELTFHGAIMVNTTGPWAEGFLAACGLPQSPIFNPLLAWNLVFHRPQISDHAIAVRAKGAGKHTYFLVPWKGALAVGTGYAIWQGGPDKPHPSRLQLHGFLEDVNEAIPGLHLQGEEISRLYAGLLPAKGPEGIELEDQPIVVDHSESGGPWGLFTVSDVKFTTARRLAADFLRRRFPSRTPIAELAFRRPRASLPPDYPYFHIPREDDDDWKVPLRQAIEREAAWTLEDLLLRRSTLGDNPARALALAGEAAKLFSWSEERCRSEVARLSKALDQSSEDIPLKVS
jgi:glycerol-3-phosphate dehydrogenase